jgi:tetratricopeptide (TPR) repeat protein
MNSVGRRILSISTLLICGVIFTLSAGVITLKNGEEISGEIVKKTDEVVEIRVDNEIRVYKREDIESIKGRKPFRVKKEVIPDSSEDFFVKGLKAAAKGEFLHAEESFAKALELDPSDESIQQALNIINDVREGKIESDFAIYLFQAADYFTTQDYEKSIEAGEKALAINPDSKEIFYNLGSAHQSLEQYEEAIPYFESLNESDPGDLEILFNLGTCHQRLQQHAEAIPYFEEIVRINPDAAEIYGFLGVSYYATAQVERAKIAVEEAKKIFEKEGNPTAAEEMEELLENLP